MSVAQVQREVSSAEFSEWIAFSIVEQELQGGEDDTPPTPDALGVKLRAWAETHNARLASKPGGRVSQEPR